MRYLELEGSEYPNSFSNISKWPEISFGPTGTGKLVGGSSPGPCFSAAAAAAAAASCTCRRDLLAQTYGLELAASPHLTMILGAFHARRLSKPSPPMRLAGLNPRRREATRSGRTLGQGP